VNGREFSRLLIQVKAASAHRASAGIFQNYARSIPMMDVVMVALAFGFFALSIAYVYACEQL
jgi:hypothetical protein